MSRVLVVDDDVALARALAINLRAHDYEVTVAHDGKSALDRIAHVHPHVVVLDLGLPDFDGIEVLHGIRGWSAVPVIVLSARSTSAEKVEALDAGADDYVTKPFGPHQRRKYRHSRFHHRSGRFEGGTERPADSAHSHGMVPVGTSCAASGQTGDFAAAARGSLGAGV